MARKSAKPVKRENPEPEQQRDEWLEIFGSKQKFELWLSKALEEMESTGGVQ